MGVLVHAALNFFHDLRKVFSFRHAHAAAKPDAIEDNATAHTRALNQQLYPSGVVIDDEEGIGEYWTLICESKPLNFKQFSDASDFLMLSKNWDLSTRLYIDWYKEDGTTRRVEVLDLLSRGFKDITIISSGILSHRDLRLPKHIKFIDKNCPPEGIF